MNYLYQINISKGGVPKLPVEEVEVTVLGILGDSQRYTKIHGGPERAICLYDIHLIHLLQEEGHPIEPGSTGENFTLDFATFSDLVPGTRLKIGKEVILEISSYTAPCKTIGSSFTDKKFKRMSQKLFPQQSRLYARVLKTGKVRKGDPVEVLSSS